MTFGQHIASTRKKARAICAKLYPLFGRQRRLDIQNQLLSVRSVISETWSHPCKTPKVPNPGEFVSSLSFGLPMTRQQQGNFRHIGSHASENGLEVESAETLRLTGKALQRHVRILLDYIPRFLNRYKRPKNELTLIDEVDDKGNLIQNFRFSFRSHGDSHSSKRLS